MGRYACTICGAKAESDDPMADFYMHMRLAHDEAFTPAATKPQARAFIRHHPPPPRRKTPGR